MESVASELRSEREKRKIPLSQIAADTRISLRHLESLEEGRYNDLPGGMYNRAFLRAYCESLSLDQREILQRYEAEISAFSEKPTRFKTHTVQRNPPLKLSPLVIWSLMLLFSASGLFFSRKWITAVFSPYFTHKPNTDVRFEQQPKPPDVPSAGEHAAPLTSAVAEPAIPSDSVVPPPSSSPEVLTSQQTPAMATAVPAKTESPPSHPVSTPALRLEIAVTEKCWISVDRDGNPAVRRVLEPGEVQYFDAAERFYLILGNAGGVRLKINDKPAKPLGKEGEVIKLVIDEENLPGLIDPTAG